MKYLCIHCHFYQPPRENPWLETIELQDSAYPYHDWNERITAECYAPNASARILDGDKRIVRIVNNYARMSFNFGPTLLSWMQRYAEETYKAVLKADRESMKQFSGHGSAIAQGFNHIIMPLANSHDKCTQIVWGIADFKSRFGRDPEAMWLPETAVDLETLDLLAKAGMRYAILAPYQAKATRPLAGGEWNDCSGGNVDPSHAYVCNLPSGRTINLFFYDGPVSRAVAFEKLLDNGEKFAERLLTGFSDARPGHQLMHIATDGETYGHHHTYGEMALAYSIEYIQARKLAKITNYGEFLDQAPAVHEVQIHENSSWSCVHGIERWRGNCGCNSGNSGWSQEWRRPLREALDWLRDKAAPYFDAQRGKLFIDPWAARDLYISVLLGPEAETREKFMRECFIPDLGELAQVRAWKWLELERHAMLMYTSCGWFFDELSGLETVQVIQYAGRVVQLFEELQGESVEGEFVRLLSRAQSNLPEYGDGADIFRRFVKPAVLNLESVCAHYAISSLFEAYGDDAEINSFSVNRMDFHVRESGRLHLGMGKARFSSKATGESKTLIFSALHLGDHNLICAVKPFRDQAEYEGLVTLLSEAFSRAETPGVVLLLDRRFGEQTYSLRSLFRDEQRKLLKRILGSTLGEAEAVYLNLYHHHAPLMRFIAGLNSPIPKELSASMEYAINSSLRRALGEKWIDIHRVRVLLLEAVENQVNLEVTTLEYTIRRNLERLAAEFAEKPMDVKRLEELRDALKVSQALPFPVILWAVQNRVYEVYQRSYKRLAGKAVRQDAAAAAWVGVFRSLAALSDVKVDP